MPEEDTFLLLKAAYEEARPNDNAIEIGCGRALISQALAPRVKSLLCTDINPYAVQAAKKAGIEVIRADLFAGIRSDFDLILFNPPYLPTTNDERTGGWIDHALDGGETGRETIDRFLEDLGAHLSPGRTCSAAGIHTDRIERGEGEGNGRGTECSRSGKWQMLL